MGNAAEHKALCGCFTQMTHHYNIYPVVLGIFDNLFTRISMNYNLIEGNISTCWCCYCDTFISCIDRREKSVLLW